MEIIAYLPLKKFVIFILVKTGAYHSYPTESTEEFLRNSIWRAIYFLGMGTTYAFVKLNLESQRQIAELDRKSLASQIRQHKLEQSLLISENAFLRAQINPHFIFNTLNFLYNQVAEFSEKTGDLLISFSDIIRYAFTEPAEDGKVYLRSEIEHIENYLLLNSKRFTGKHYLNFKVIGDVKDLRILPLILITIIENVYKYADLSNATTPAEIELSINGNQVEFNVRNKKAHKTYAGSQGIGITNISKRLEAIYGDIHELIIRQDDDCYNLNLKLIL